MQEPLTGDALVARAEYERFIQAELDALNPQNVPAEQRQPRPKRRMSVRERREARIWLYGSERAAQSICNARVRQPLARQPRARGAGRPRARRSPSRSSNAPPGESDSDGPGEAGHPFLLGGRDRRLAASMARIGTVLR